MARLISSRRLLWLLGMLLHQSSTVHLGARPQTEAEVLI
jgi:hypothetical protein